MDKPPRAAGCEDLISDLPFEILSAIISLLATAEAARAAVLSTRWRDAWRGTPLRLDDLELPAPVSALSDAVTRSLAIHPGPVARFRLVRTFLDRVTAAEAWFRDLAAAKPARDVSVFLCYKTEWCPLALADPLIAFPTLESRDSRPGPVPHLRRRDRRHSTPASRSSPCRPPPLRGLASERALRLPRAAQRHAQAHQGPPQHPRQFLTSCLNPVLLGVWFSADVKELTMEDAPRLERLLGSVHLGMAMSVVNAPKLTALGYFKLRLLDI